MNLFCCCQIMAPNTRITRKWEIFAGRNKFYCDGLLMSAPHTGVFYLTCFLITGTSALFFAYDCPDLATRITPFIPIIGAVLYFFTMSSLLRTTFTDPGIIPRASHDEAAYIEKQIEVPNSLNSPTYRPPPRTKEVLVKGQVVKLKYCFTCKIFRPPRASHCSLCDNCVDRFDHHCPWVGNCVGKRNYRFFYMFLVSLAFLAVFIFSCSITHLVLLMKEKKEVWEVIKSAPCSVVVTIICFFSIWSVIGLAGFHTYLTTSDQTTNEDLKGSFSSKGGQRAVNPYSRGNICLNCVHILCGPMTPSLIDRRGVVTDDFMLQMHPIYSPAHPVTEIPTIQTPTMITQQPVISGADVLKPLPRLFDETLSASGMYRHRSYDNLQNGKSPLASYRLKRQMPMPYSPSFDRNSPLPLMHRQITLQSHVDKRHSIFDKRASLSDKRNSIVPIPSEFEYYSPQRGSDSSSHSPLYGLSKKFGVARQGSTQSVDSSGGGEEAGIKETSKRKTGIPMRKIYTHKPKLKIPPFEIKSPTNRLTLRECDFGGGGEPIDDESVKDSQIFRVSKRNLYMNHRSPWIDRKERYSNVYEYSFNIDLNSIIEDAAASDSS